MYDNIITVPLCSGGKFALAKVQIGSDLFYNMLSVEAINIEELTPYDFFKYNCLGLEPLDLMEYNIPISINPYAMLQEYYKTIENVSSIYEVSGFSPTPYIRIHYDNTDVFFELINTATNTPINNIADITNDVSYDELSWEFSRSYIREDQ